MRRFLLDTDFESIVVVISGSGQPVQFLVPHLIDRFHMFAEDDCIVTVWHGAFRNVTNDKA